MALPTTRRFGQMLVYIEDPAVPGTWIAPCGFNSKSISFTKELTDIVIPDCADPDAVAAVGREVRSTSWSISGSGVLALEALTDWRNFYNSIASWNVRVEIVSTAGQGGGVYEGKAHMASMELSAELGDKVQLAVEIQSDGEVVFTPT